jgi:hypothetical protein
MRKFKSKLGLLAFVLLAMSATSLIFVLSVSSQVQRKGDDTVSISWSPKEREIKSVGSKLLLNLPESVSSQDWVIGVMPTKENENERIVVGVVSWKDSQMGRQTKIETVNDMSDNSIKLISGQADLTGSNDFGLNSDKSLLILLRVKPETKIIVLQRSEEILAKTTTNDSGIMTQSGPSAMEKAGIKRITGVSSLLGELQTRKFFQRLGKNN